MRGLKKQKKFLLSGLDYDSGGDKDVETSGFGSYDELVLSYNILERTCGILKDFKDICDEFRTDKFNFV